MNSKEVSNAISDIIHSPVYLPPIEVETYADLLGPNVQKIRKQSCSGCGANSIYYELSDKHCFDCGHPIEYEDICMCNN